MAKARYIFHITNHEAWRAAKETGGYTHDSITSEGFIHCSYRQQVLPSAKKHFTCQKDLIVLCISVNELIAELRVERGVGSTQDFPHIYGAINLDAVKQIIEFTPDDPDEFLRLSTPFSV